MPKVLYKKGEKPTVAEALVYLNLDNRAGLPWLKATPEERKNLTNKAIQDLKENNSNHDEKPMDIKLVREALATVQGQMTFDTQVKIMGEIEKVQEEQRKAPFKEVLGEIKENKFKLKTTNPTVSAASPAPSHEIEITAFDSKPITIPSSIQFQAILKKMGVPDDELKKFTCEPLPGNKGFSVKQDNQYLLKVEDVGPGKRKISMSPTDLSPEMQAQIMIATLKASYGVESLKDINGTIKMKDFDPKVEAAFRELAKKDGFPDDRIKVMDAKPVVQNKAEEAQKEAIEQPKPTSLSAPAA